MLVEPAPREKQETGPTDPNHSPFTENASSALPDIPPQNP